MIRLRVAGGNGGRGLRDRREAEQALAHALTGEVATSGSLTVGAFLDQWLAGHISSLKPSTAKSYAEVVQWYVQPRLGRVKLVDLNALLIRSLYADLLANGGRRRRAELSPATVAVCTAARPASDSTVSK